jgi:hypothetical protein
VLVVVTGAQQQHPALPSCCRVMLSYHRVQQLPR